MKEKSCGHRRALSVPINNLHLDQEPIEVHKHQEAKKEFLHLQRCFWCYGLTLKYPEQSSGWW